MPEARDKHTEMTLEVQLSYLDQYKITARGLEHIRFALIPDLEIQDCWGDSTIHPDPFDIILLEYATRVAFAQQDYTSEYSQEEWAQWTQVLRKGGYIKEIK